jgi:hypothetical protein
MMTTRISAVTNAAVNACKASPESDSFFDDNSLTFFLLLERDMSSFRNRHSHMYDHIPEWILKYQSHDHCDSENTQDEKVHEKLLMLPNHVHCLS